MGTLRAWEEVAEAEEVAVKAREVADREWVVMEGEVARVRGEERERVRDEEEGWARVEGKGGKGKAGKGGRGVGR